VVRDILQNSNWDITLAGPLDKLAGDKHMYESATEKEKAKKVQVNLDK
jgi:hypothetical protein